jgi:hypothetical protein
MTQQDMHQQWTCTALIHQEQFLRVLCHSTAWNMPDIHLRYSCWLHGTDVLCAADSAANLAPPCFLLTLPVTNVLPNFQ